MKNKAFGLFVLVILCVIIALGAIGIKTNLKGSNKSENTSTLEPLQEKEKIEEIKDTEEYSFGIYPEEEREYITERYVEDLIKTRSEDEVEQICEEANNYIKDYYSIMFNYKGTSKKKIKKLKDFYVTNWDEYDANNIYCVEKVMKAFEYNNIEEMEFLDFDLRIARFVDEDQGEWLLTTKGIVKANVKFQNEEKKETYSTVYTSMVINPDEHTYRFFAGYPLEIYNKEPKIYFGDSHRETIHTGDLIFKWNVNEFQEEVEEEAAQKENSQKTTELTDTTAEGQ